jgi:4-amino-4-deoxy-L-arabinose transferase-like glycosyltransferase
MTDMALATMAALALYLLLRAYDNWEGDTAWAYIGAGFVCGLAASTKFTGALLIVPLLVVPLLCVRQLDDVLRWRVIGGPLAMATGFLVSTPYALLDMPKFVQFTAYVLAVYNRAGYDVLGSTWRWQLDYLFTDRNAALAYPAAAGLLISLFRWGRRGWIVNSFALVVLLTALTTGVRESRTWLPLAPVACVWAALALETALLWLRRRWPGRPADQAAVYGILLLLVLLALVGRSAQAVRNLRGPDVRALVAAWIEDNVPPGSLLAFDRSPPYVDPDVWPVLLNFGHYDQDLEAYRQQGVRYVIGSDIIQNENRLSAGDMARWQAMTDQLCLIKTFTGPVLAASGLTFWVYEMPPCAPAADS